MTQRTPTTSNAKRHCPDNTETDNTGDDFRIRTQSLPGNLSHVIGDPSKYKAIIVPTELAPIIEKLCQDLLQKYIQDKNKVITNEQDDEVFTRQEPDEDIQSTFLNEFESARRFFDNALKKTNEKTLIENVETDQFDKFKIARTLLTKWYVTGAHLQRKLKGNSDSNKYLKVNFDFSVAISDSSLKEKCTSKLLNTKKLIERSLTTSVLEKAIYLNAEARALWDKTPKNIFLKAYRVVSKANKHLFNLQQNERPKPQNKTQNYYNKNNKDPPRRDLYNKYQWDSRRPRFESNRYSYREDNRRDYEEEYPPPRHDNYNYRRYKRQPSHGTEDDYLPLPFRNEPRSFYRRQSRGDFYD